MFQQYIGHHKKKGFTLSEIIIAIAVLSFGVVLVYGAFFVAFNTTMSTGPRFIAAYLAQDGQEIIRNLRDNNIVEGEFWSAGLTGSPCNAGCQADYKTLETSELDEFTDTVLSLNADGFYGYDIGGTPTIFKREIMVSPVLGTTDVIKVLVLITWDYKGEPFSLTAEEYLYDE